MQVNIQSIHFSADQKLKDYINAKLDKLTTFYDQIIQADVYLKLENEGAPIQDKVVEVRLHIPGNDLFAKETRMSFEEAADEVAENLRRQIKKQKEKISAK
ncbi:MAG TPA: ribosome-associated translation inhibitor RaiA [Chitinophagales bacterium]|nr:ribosome-associated translation inhibitor RaiA [Chitinophagales bacterium]HAE34310.1 ribosome-associated translation inhibitor RaiA [Bacteroidota bacterium]HPE97202.1 ribosome-associated translation inhibitor RaiA [Chitinophagales bacterium]HPR28744.1 ribosome-associated translation inhibitor RaiA [Chitinophagales bacterium]HQU76659.1 ribosome-associated translation inhibitor RaiA [Chitinophagales bacterium]